AAIDIERADLHILHPVSFRAQEQMDFDPWPERDEMSPCRTGHSRSQKNEEKSQQDAIAHFWIKVNFPVLSRSGAGTIVIQSRGSTCATHRRISGLPSMNGIHASGLSQRYQHPAAQ